ncbi:PopZ family protein [Bradyrhizobium sp. STM 3562]|uniref:PopZ family protein n=1 Tax=Bradyrhizobium sp. STM 3562 TaxID=578924 RepID=UPI00388D96B4
MTQPAKVQEPSMEEILASIRRIIADDEAKPPAAEKPVGPPPAPPPPAAAKPEKPAAPPAAAKPATADAPSSKIAAAAPVPPKVAAPPPPPAPPQPAPAPAVAASNSQDDIDALLAGLDETTTPEEVRPPQPDGEVFELTDEMAVPAPQASPPQPQPSQASFQKVEPDDDIEFAESAASRAIHRQPAYDPPPFAAPPAPSREILSQSTVTAVESAFNTLANTVLSNNARTLEDLVKEMLRPMLKSWLDDNLPGLVERIVKAEIERVSRGR